MPGPAPRRSVHSNQPVVVNDPALGREVSRFMPWWKESCSYCGAAVPKQEDCPTEFIHRAADALKE